MGDSRKRFDRAVEVHGSAPEQLATNLVRALCEIDDVIGEERDSRTVVPVQATGATLAEMLHGLIGDVLDAVEASPTQVIDADISHVMMSGDGLRAWGYLWFGTERSSIAHSSLSGPPCVTELSNGELSASITLSRADEQVDDPAMPAVAQDCR